MSANFFTEFNRFEYRTITMPAAADVINFPNARCANEFHECLDKIGAVNVVTHLFRFVSEDPIRPISYRADRQVRKKAVQLCAGLCRSSDATAAKGNCWHSEIGSIFLHQKI